MTAITFYAHPQLTAHLFAEVNGLWFSVNRASIYALTSAPRVNANMVVKMNAITSQFLRHTEESIRASIAA